MIKKQSLISYLSKKHYIALMALFFISASLLWNTSVFAKDVETRVHKDVETLDSKDVETLNSKDVETLNYKITSPITGMVKKVYVVSGQTIKKGDLLLEFDPDLIMSNLMEAKAKLSFEKLNQAEAKKEFERAEELYDRTVLSEQELQQAKIIYTKAIAQYAAAQNKRVHVQWHLDHTKLYATFSGKVKRVLSYPGQFVNNKLAAQPLIIIQSL